MSSIAHAIAVQERAWLVMWRPYGRVFTAWHMADPRRCVSVEAPTEHQLRLRMADAELELWQTSHTPTQARLATPQRPAGEVRQPPTSDPGSCSRPRDHQGTPDRHASRGRGHHRRQTS
ncbi:hypothetical protein [Nonomuraea dietziae]|uniref:hypothetical protein n=1 Tax=Nonomuraea dietziae TaxID=65515 RepID=UPI0031DCDAE7